ncbi:MAG: glucose-6-phosphate isomerase [Oscillospiraceae bacterium]|jgi:glucose-6-phosphate isomerase|nr:glucose-6-phosphate isomerase [Oscillospiraceae bacterium]
MAESDKDAKPEVRRRGRPLKAETAPEQPSKRRRGRPPKSAAEQDFTQPLSPAEAARAAKMATPKPWYTDAAETPRGPLRLRLDYTGGQQPDADLLAKLAEKTAAAQRTLAEGTGEGADMRGWMEWPTKYRHSAEYESLRDTAAKIRAEADVLLVIGIGGSYLGARAVVEAVRTQYYNELRGNGPAIYFCGNSLSEAQFAALDELIEGRDFFINVISKSGTTMEPAIAFRHYYEKLSSKYPHTPLGRAQVNRRIFVTTDAAEGALRAQSKHRWKCFVIPPDVGGRYSVLTAVGLLPIAVAGIDTQALLQGAADAQAAYEELPPQLKDKGEQRDALASWLRGNPSAYYAALRYYYYRYKRKQIEMLACYEPGLTMFCEWYKQLFGESEGKDSVALFPAKAIYTTDLHSMGQYVQEGERCLFETVLQFGAAENNIAVLKRDTDGDELNYLAGMPLHLINRTAFQATALAHSQGDVPNLVLELPARSVYHLGWLIYFFERACALSGYLLEINPFDQNGVEQYKKYMHALLGKQGDKHDAVRAELRTKGFRTETAADAE